MSINYRVDSAKLPWNYNIDKNDTRPITPVQCFACQERQRKRSLLDRLSRFLFQQSFEVFIAERDANRCVLYLGHWAYRDQREHINGWNERWPVTAEDTRPFNPDGEQQ